MKPPRQKITPELLARSGTEDGEQTALFCYARAMEAADHRWGLLHAIPNGGKRGVATAARLAATGTKPGYPDVGLDVASNGFHGLRIELKRLAHLGKPAGAVSEDQKYWHQALRLEGYCVWVCYGWNDAAHVIAEYLKGNIKDVG